jgi:hypothetical protein
MRWLFVIGQCIAVLCIIGLSATAKEKVAVWLCGCAVGAVIVDLSLRWLRLARVKSVSRRPVFIAASVSLAAIASVMATAWPLRLSYLLSRPSLQRLGTAIDPGQRTDGPVRAGLFVVKRAEVSPQGRVCLWTELEPGGNTGFVRCGMNGLPVNLWSSIQLDEQWYLVAED